MSPDNDNGTNPPLETTENQIPVSNDDLETGWLDRRIGDRPLIVYLAMAAGLAVLALLLGIVWMSATGGGEADQPLCLDITPDEAETRILKGDVRSLDVLTDKVDPLGGLTLIQLTFDSDECAKLPEGADNRNDLFEILGVATHYNETTSDRIQIDYTYKDVPQALLRTSTPMPTPTPEVTPAPTEATSTIEPTRTPSPEPSATAVVTTVAAPTVRPTLAPSPTSVPVKEATPATP